MSETLGMSLEEKELSEGRIKLIPDPRENIVDFAKRLIDLSSQTGKVVVGSFSPGTVLSVSPDEPTTVQKLVDQYVANCYEIQEANPGTDMLKLTGLPGESIKTFAGKLIEVCGQINREVVGVFNGTSLLVSPKKPKTVEELEKEYLETMDN